MIATCTIDSTGLNTAIAFASRWTKRTPSEVVNTVGGEVAIGAKNGMPFVTVPTIDTELAVTVTPKIGKRGKPLKRGKQYSGGSGTASNPDVALAVLIIQARARPGSNYNALTNNRYALTASPFKGLSRAAGRAAMAAMVSQMIARRHSSGAFLKAGWIECVKDLLPYSVNRFRRGSSNGPPLEGARSYYGANLGGATPAQSGSVNAVCVIENDIGYEGANAASFDKALQLHGLPVLQNSLDKEGRNTMDYALNASNKELEQGFNRLAG